MLTSYRLLTVIRRVNCEVGGRAPTPKLFSPGVDDRPICGAVAVLFAAANSGLASPTALGLARQGKYRADRHCRAPSNRRNVHCDRSLAALNLSDYIFLF